MHALIIEPQSLIQLMLEDELRQLGFTSFDSAVTKEAAIAAAQRRRPDLVTTSLRLMDGNGIDAVDVICSSQPIPAIYIVSNPTEAREVLEGSVFITKPVSKRSLKKAVEKVMPQVKVKQSLTVRSQPSA